MWLFFCYCFKYCCYNYAIDLVYMKIKKPNTVTFTVALKGKLGVHGTLPLKNRAINSTHSEPFLYKCVKTVWTFHTGVFAVHLHYINPLHYPSYRPFHRHWSLQLSQSILWTQSQSLSVKLFKFSGVWSFQKMFKDAQGPLNKNLCI